MSAPSAMSGAPWPLDTVLAAWTHYEDLSAEDAPLPERLAAWGALQDARERARSGVHD